MARPRSAPWTRDERLVVLASYVQRPRGVLVPPPVERDRLASKLRRSSEGVTERLWAFAGLDPDNMTADRGDADGMDEELWQQYAEDRLALVVDADEVERRQASVPRALRGRAPGAKRP